MRNKALEYVERLKKGRKLNDEEVQLIKSRLENPSKEDDVYNFCRALALGSPPTIENVSLVEKYLAPPTDDWNRQGAIKALCYYWGLTANYVETLKPFMLTVAWKDNPSAAISAFSAIGDYLSKTEDHGCFKFLLELYHDDYNLFEKQDKLFDSQHIELIYRAIARGVLKAPLLKPRFTFPDDISLQILEQAREFARA